MRGLICWCLGIVVACGGSSSSVRHFPAASAAGLVSWGGLAHVRGVVDLTAPLSRTGAIRVAARGRLETLSGAGALEPFRSRYSAPLGLEPYIALSSGQRVAGAGCRFARGGLYALRLRDGHGVTVVDPSGRVRRFAALPSGGLENGIAFDLTGRFGHRLLVTNHARTGTTVDAIDCRGRVSVLTRHGPRVEGGLAVAPATFGRFAGDLIAPDEITGNLYAIAPSGHAVLIANSGLAHGQDVGAESEGFVPARFTAALVADRGTPHNRHPGDDEILALPRRSLLDAGVTAGDLLVVDEGAAGTIAVTCRSSCRVRHVADGPIRAHIEGHIVFSRAS